MDPVARGKILDAIVKFYDEDSSLIISTHLVNDIERIFDEVVFIREGQLVMREEVETLRLKYGKVWMKCSRRSMRNDDIIEV